MTMVTRLAARRPSMASRHTYFHRYLYTTWGRQPSIFSMSLRNLEFTYTHTNHRKYIQTVEEETSYRNPFVNCFMHLKTILRLLMANLVILLFSFLIIYRGTMRVGHQS